MHCLVRADSPARGLDRIREGMAAAEIWDDALAERITVWTGDIGEPLLGLAEEDFARLAGEVDAVYHLAADLNLISSYPAVRETNTRSLATVLELALTRRVKHVIYASTMGDLPAVLRQLRRRVRRAARPGRGDARHRLMRSVLPPGLVGYPWSKLVAEQGLLFARAFGVPIAIMRLPQTGIAASTGFTQSTDIKVRIVTAVLDTGMAPAGFQTMWTEPVDTVSEILVRLSLRPRRRHVIYHLVNPRPSTHGLALADFGLPVKEVSYQEFKRACQARGAARAAARPLAADRSLRGPVVPGVRRCQPAVPATTVPVPERPVPACQLRHGRTGRLAWPLLPPTWAPPSRSGRG